MDKTIKVGGGTGARGGGQARRVPVPRSLEAVALLLGGHRAGKRELRRDPAVGDPCGDAEAAGAEPGVPGTGSVPHSSSGCGGNAIASAQLPVPLGICHENKSGAWDVCVRVAAEELNRFRISFLSSTVRISV